MRISIGRKAELEKELDEIVKQSEGWLREEIEERVVKRFQSVSFPDAAVHSTRTADSLLAEARAAFKERLTRLATPKNERSCSDAVETAVTLRRVDALIYLHQMLKVWIAPHVISTSVMLALMIVHVIQVCSISQ